MWTDVKIDDDERLSACAAVMKQVDRAYTRFDARTFMRFMFVERARVFQYVDDTLQIVGVIEYAVRMKQWRLKTMGFVGDVSLDQVFDIGATKLDSLLRSMSVSEFFVIVRRNLDNPLMNAFADYALRTAFFDVMVEHVMNDCEAVRFGLKPGP